MVTGATQKSQRYRKVSTNTVTPITLHSFLLQINVSLIFLPPPQSLGGAASKRNTTIGAVSLLKLATKLREIAKKTTSRAFFL